MYICIMLFIIQILLICAGITQIARSPIALHVPQSSHVLSVIHVPCVFRTSQHVRTLLIYWNVTGCTTFHVEHQISNHLLIYKLTIMKRLFNINTIGSTILIGIVITIIACVVFGNNGIWIAHVSINN